VQRDENKFGVWQAAGVTVLYFVICGVVSPLVERLLRSVGARSADDAAPLLAGLLAGFVVAASLVVWREVSLRRWRRLERADWHIPPRALAGWLVLVIGQGFFLAETDNWFRAVWPPPESLVVLFDRITDLRENPLLVIATVAVVGPIAEEVVMRGIVLRGLLRTLPARSAILWSAVLFMAMHLNPWQALPTLVIGLVLGWAYARTRSLGLCIVAHILNNGLSVAVAAWAKTSPEAARFFAQEPGEFQPWWITAAGLAALVVGLWLFARATPEPPKSVAAAPSLPADDPR